jgi:UDP-galactopyranose mutase
MAISSLCRADVLVVGAGFAGAIMAERIATELNLRVLVVDRRDHIAGNAFDERDEQGVLVHRYGPHLFHANNERIVRYLSRFTDWQPYEHRVRAWVDGQLLPVPINLETINTLYGLNLDATAMERWIAARAEPIERVSNAEDAVVARMGRDIYERFFRGYTSKQWGLEPAELDASVTARIPLRCSNEDRYFTDAFQALPRQGYTAMFRRILDHPLIDVCLSTDHLTAREIVGAAHTVFTGPIDEYFGHCFGKLPYRSLRFEWHTVPTPGGQPVHPVGQINYPSAQVPYTRLTEFRHFSAPSGPLASTIAVEYPSASGDPFYPVPAPGNRDRYAAYERLASQQEDVTFVGRLARYQYLNMDQVVGQALASFRARRQAIRRSVERARDREALLAA